MKRTINGFTLVELLIVIVIMVILMALGVVSVSGLQAQGRDSERKNDVEALARGIEVRYIKGNPRATAPMIEKGAYPGVNEMLHAIGYDRTAQNFVPTVIAGGYLSDIFPGVTKETLTSPKGDGLYISCSWACQPAETMSFIESVTTTGAYVYEPVDANGNVCCCNGCVRFNLYYRTERDSQLHTVKSVHR